MCKAGHLESVKKTILISTGLMQDGAETQLVEDHHVSTANTSNRQGSVEGRSWLQMTFVKPAADRVTTQASTIQSQGSTQWSYSSARRCVCCNSLAALQVEHSPGYRRLSLQYSRIFLLMCSTVAEESTASPKPKAAKIPQQGQSLASISTIPGPPDLASTSSAENDCLNRRYVPFICTAVPLSVHAGKAALLTLDQNLLRSQAA